MWLAGGKINRNGASAMAKAAVNLLETQVNTVCCTSGVLSFEFLRLGGCSCQFATSPMSTFFIIENSILNP